VSEAVRPSRLARVGAWLRRVFNSVKPILADIGTNVAGPALAEIQKRKVKTDAERRAIVQDLVASYIAKKFPQYAFLADKATDIVFEFVRERLKKK
jgi:hypothetical protein